MTPMEIVGVLDDAGLLADPADQDVQERQRHQALAGHEPRAARAEAEVSELKREVDRVQFKCALRQQEVEEAQAERAEAQDELIKLRGCLDVQEPAAEKLFARVDAAETVLAQVRALAETWIRHGVMSSMTGTVMHRCGDELLATLGGRSAPDSHTATPDAGLRDALARALTTHRVECVMTAEDSFGWHCLTCGAEAHSWSSIEAAEQASLAHHVDAVMQVVEGAINEARRIGVRP